MSSRIMSIRRFGYRSRQDRTNQQGGEGEVGGGAAAAVQVEPDRALHTTSNAGNDQTKRQRPRPPSSSQYKPKRIMHRSQPAPDEMSSLSSLYTSSTSPPPPLSKAAATTTTAADIAGGTPHVPSSPSPSISKNDGDVETAVDTRKLAMRILNETHRMKQKIRTIKSRKLAATDFLSQEWHGNQPSYYSSSTSTKNNKNGRINKYNGGGFATKSIDGSYCTDSTAGDDSFMTSSSFSSRSKKSGGHATDNSRDENEVNDADDHDACHDEYHDEHGHDDDHNDDDDDHHHHHDDHHDDGIPNTWKCRNPCDGKASQWAPPSATFPKEIINKNGNILKPIKNLKRRLLERRRMGSQLAEF